MAESLAEGWAGGGLAAVSVVHAAEAGSRGIGGGCEGEAWREASMHLFCRYSAGRSPKEPPTLPSQGYLSGVVSSTGWWFSSSSLPRNSPSAIVPDTSMVPVDPTVQPARRPTHKRRFDPQRFSRAAEPILFRFGQIGQAHEERFPKEPAARPSGSALFVDREALEGGRRLGGQGGCILGVPSLPSQWKACTHSKGRGESGCRPEREEPSMRFWSC